MPILSRSTAWRGATILMFSVTAAACSGGGAGSPAGATTAPAGSQPPAASTTIAGSPSSEISRYCNAIKLPDAQALVKDTITQDYFEPLEPTPPYDCTMVTSVGGGDLLKVTIDTTDHFARWVADENVGTGTALTGVGDKAVWIQALANAPTVVAIKGSVTCRVTVPSTEKTTIEFTTDSNGFNKISAAAAVAFAQKMAVLCTDVFGASS